VLIDHQPFQLANVNSHEPTMVINNAIGLAMTAKAYGIPTILTTVTEERGGRIPGVTRVVNQMEIKIPS
jgi:nicotinamidase-related amidase